MRLFRNTAEKSWNDTHMQIALNQLIGGWNFQLSCSSHSYRAAEFVSYLTSTGKVLNGNSWYSEDTISMKDKAIKAIFY